MGIKRRTAPSISLPHTPHPAIGPSHGPRLRQIPTHIPPYPRIIQQPLDLPDRGNGNIAIPQLPLRETHHVLLRNTAHRPLDFLGVQPSPRRDDLPSDILRDGRRPVQRKQDGGFELCLRALGFRLGDLEGEAGPLAQSEVDEVVDPRERVRDHVDSPQSRIAVRRGEGHERIREFVLMDEGAEFTPQVGRVAHRAIPVADDGLRDERGEVVVVLPAHALDRDGDVGRRHRVVAYPHLGADEVGFRHLPAVAGGVLRVRVVGGHVGEVLLGELDELVVRDAAGADEDHAVRCVVRLDVVGQLVAGDGLDVLFRAEDGAAEGLVLEGGGVEMVEDDFFQLLVNLFLFAENHVPLPFNRALL